MDQNNIQLKTTVECRSPNATDVVLRVNPLIPRGMSRNVAVLTTPYKLIVSVCKIQPGARGVQLKENFTRPFLLKDRCQEWKLLSKTVWIMPDGCLQEIYISIKVVYENFNMTDGRDFIIIS